LERRAFQHVQRLIDSLQLPKEKTDESQWRLLFQQSKFLYIPLPSRRFIYMLMGSGKQLQTHWSLKPVVAGCCFGTGQTNPFPLILNTAFRNYGLVGNFHIPLGPFMGCLIWTGDGIISMISQGWTWVSPNVQSKAQLRNVPCNFHITLCQYIMICHDMPTQKKSLCVLFFIAV
jgi:hypothetical protein